MFNVKQIVSPIYVVVDIILIFSSFFIAYFFRYNNFLSKTYQFPDINEYIVIFLIWAILILLDLRRKKLFVTDRNLSIPSESGRVFSAVSRSTILVGTFIFVLQYKFFSRNVFCYSFLYTFVFLSLWRLLKRLFVRQFIKEGYQNKSVLIVGTDRVAQIVTGEILEHSYLGLKIVGYLANEQETDLAVLGKIDEFDSVVKHNFIDEIIITLPTATKEMAKLIEKAKQMRIGVRVVPADFEHSYPVLDIGHLGIVPLLTYKEHVRHASESTIKRVFDILCSLLLIILLSPIIILFAILIKLESKGPVFFMQKRVGVKGKTFDFYKFRSMVVNAEELKASLKEQNEVKDGVIFKIKDDPRVTKIGRFIRKYSIDELPQLFNVLKGDMSLVGPRPPVPSEVKEYDSEQMERLSIRPGITGMSQVKGRSELSFRNWVRWDIWYINNWSFGLDIMILFWTVPAVIKGKGAY